MLNLSVILGDLQIFPASANLNLSHVLQNKSVID